VQRRWHPPTRTFVLPPVSLCVGFAINLPWHQDPTPGTDIAPTYRTVMVLIRNTPRPLGRGLDACFRGIHGSWCSYHHKARAQEDELFERIRASQQTGTTRRPTCRAKFHTFLCDWKYHEPPPSPHSPALVVYKNPSRGFNSSYHVDAGVASQDTVSEAVAEELEAVNAIYGSGTLQILASDQRKV